MHFQILKKLFVPKNELALFDKITRLSKFKKVRVGVDNGFKIGTNVTAIFAPGHEIGHTVYKVSKAGRTLLV